jgi:hypothetical protein
MQHATAARRRGYAQLAFATLFMLTAVGPFVTSQGIFTTLARRGLYGDRCGDAGFPCAAQRHAIASALDLSASVTNFAAFPAGILFDLAGGYWTGVAAASVWLVAMSLAGVAPASGAVWMACYCVAAAAGSAAYNSIVLFHLPTSCAGDRSALPARIGMQSAMYSSSAFFTVALSYYLAAEGAPLAVLYAGYGAVIGGAAVAGFALLFPRVAVPYDDAIAADGAAADCDESAAGETNAAGAAEPLVAAAAGGDAGGGTGAALALRDSLRELRVIAATPLFWASTAVATTIVTTTYFLTANAGALARYNGATAAEADDVRRVVAYMQGCNGAPTVLIFAAVGRLGPHRGLLTTIALSIVLALLWGSLPFALAGDYRAATYAPFAAAFLWNACGFTVVNLAVPLFFAAEHPAGIGAAFGLLMTVSGGASMVVGGLMTNAVQADVSTFGSIIIGLVVTDVLVALMFLGPTAAAMRRAAPLTAEGEPRLVANESSA